MRKACRSPGVTGSPVPRSKRDGAVSFGLKSRASGPPAIASIKAESGAAKLQGDTASGADDPAQEAAILSKSPGPSPMALVNGTERTLDLPQAEDKTLPAESHAQIDNRPPAVPAAPASHVNLVGITTGAPSPRH
jgi:hypothetical protein